MNTTAEIYDLMETTGKSAPDITQALKNIGGDMQTGVKKIATYFLDEGRYEGYQVGKQIGEKSGLLKGTTIGLAIPVLFGTGYYLYDKHKVILILLRLVRQIRFIVLPGYRRPVMSQHPRQLLGIHAVL